MVSTCWVTEIIPLNTLFVNKSCNQRKEEHELREERDRIRLMLYRNSLTNTWLINRLEDNGVKTDKTEMSSVLRGTRSGAKAELIINKSLDILNYYEKHFPSARNCEP